MSERQALEVVWRHKAFWIFVALASLLLAGLAAAWLWLPDSKAWTVGLSALDGLALITGMAWLLCLTFAYYRRVHAGEEIRFWPLAGSSLRRAPVLLVWVVLFDVALWLASRPSLPKWTWAVVPMVLLPLASRAEVEGFCGFFRWVWHVRFFVDYVALFVLGVYVPAKLAAWRLPLNGVTMETVSLAVRFAIAYVMMLTAWLAAASILGRLSAPEPSKAAAHSAPA